MPEQPEKAAAVSDRKDLEDSAKTAQDSWDANVKFGFGSKEDGYKLADKLTATKRALADYDKTNAKKVSNTGLTGATGTKSSSPTKPTIRKRIATKG
jgi:hypothetical protein